ncbi:Elongation factor P--(R)-beta-lysine ligase [Candidatus Ecksteinia adelgidicola]|nr:Elongation factor P--(R)-beta-lysine ligase [Candidatus Ecksteinia adelgidicola]
MNKIIKWKPNASITNLLKRAKILTKIRKFFKDRNILEVETPMMSHRTVTDVYLSSFKTYFVKPNSNKKILLYMITSPEFHMKRLLAAGSGAIYQLGRSFRNQELGPYHNPEFTILEWYRPYYSMYKIMNEVNELLKKVLNCNNADMLSYQEIFFKYFNIDPILLKKNQLLQLITKLSLSNVPNYQEDKNTLLQLLFTIGIEPHLGKKKPIFIYHFPADQAVSATIHPNDHKIAERFEVYFKGIELANGFHELIDYQEQYQRFKKDNQQRALRGFSKQLIDNNLLTALQHGIPDCSGVAIGVDRLVMLAIGAKNLNETLSFSIDRA